LNPLLHLAEAQSDGLDVGATEVAGWHNKEVRIVAHYSSVLFDESGESLKLRVGGSVSMDGDCIYPKWHFPGGPGLTGNKTESLVLIWE
jgi:hypothetical protein